MGRLLQSNYERLLTGMKVGLVGLGKAGQSLFYELVQNPEIHKIVIFDTDETQYRYFPTSRGNQIEIAANRNFLDSSFDLLIIATPDNLHLDYLLEAVSLNIPAFVEKPIVSSHEQLILLRNMIASNPHYKFTTNLILRTSPLFNALRDSYNSGFLGTRVFIEGKYLYGRWEKLQRGWRGYDGYSVTLGGLIHLIDICCYITSNYKYAISLFEKRITNKEPIHVNDFSNIVMSSDNSGIHTLSTTFSAETDHRRDLSIFSDFGYIEIKGTQVSANMPPGWNFEEIQLLPPSKGALLGEFIRYLSRGDLEAGHFPKASEVLSVVEMCLGKSTL